MNKKILVTGAFGLVGTDLVLQLRKKYSSEQIVVVQHNTKRDQFDVLVEHGDVTDEKFLERVIKKHNIGEIYHLAGLLSVGSEKDPQLAWKVNLGGLKTVLDLSVTYKCKVFWPSSIAAFGPTTPRVNTPQHTVLEPTTMYGVNKVSGELLCQYYHLRYGLDVRSLRYPGLIAHKAPPGDGTTEYSVHIFYGALREKKYICFLKKDARLPMMFIDDAIKGTLQLMAAPAKKISVRTSYNFTAIDITPEELVAEIQKIMPEFTCAYKPDQRQKIADSWPDSIDDTQAREDWGWKPDVNLGTMTRIMLEEVGKKLAKKI